VRNLRGEMEGARKGDRGKINLGSRDNALRKGKKDRKEGGGEHSANRGNWNLFWGLKSTIGGILGVKSQGERARIGRQGKKPKNFGKERKGPGTGGGPTEFRKGKGGRPGQNRKETASDYGRQWVRPVDSFFKKKMQKGGK